MNRIVATLLALRRDFSPAARRRRQHALRAARRLPLRPSNATVAYHDALLFATVYPDDPRTIQLAHTELRRAARALHAGRASDADAWNAVFANTGVAGSAVEHGYSIDLLRWLHQRFGRQVELAWDAGSLGTRFDELLQAAITTPEVDGLFDETLTMQQWVSLARGASTGSDLAWLLRFLEQTLCPPALLEALFSATDVRVRWRLGSGGGSRTFTRFPPRPTFHQREPLQRDVNVRQLLAEALPPPVRLTGSDIARLIDVARATLAVRGRETDPVTNANPREVTLFRLERGVDVALFGLLPERRLAVESYFGFVAARNRVPVAYGGGWVFFHRCEIGVNLFEEFRGGESALLFAQVLRVYHQHYRANQFLVDPFQFGAENSEGLTSGAFWFYYRLGFRPTAADLRLLAARESQRAQADRIHRTPLRVNKRLTGSKLFLDIADRRIAATRPVVHLDDHRATREGLFLPVAPELTKLGLALTGWIARRFDGDRAAAQKWAIQSVRRSLRIRGTERWTAAESAAFERLCPLVAMIPELSRWPHADRAALVALLRAKGGQRERTFMLALQKNHPLHRAWTALGRARDV